MIVVYTSPACVQCRATKRYLKERNTPFLEVDVDHADAAARAFLPTLGFSRLPVVLTEPGGGRWQGFRPDLLDHYIATHPY